MKSNIYLYQLQQELDKIKIQIIEKFSPQKIILFGSLSKKDITLTSDIDIILIKKTDLSFKERMNRLYTVIDYSLPVDMFFYTPEEIERLKEKNSFIKKALSEGVVIYEKE